MELLIPTEKISLLWKVSHGVSVTVVHPSLGNHCSWFVLVLAVLLVLCQFPVSWEQHSVRGCSWGRQLTLFHKEVSVKSVGISKATGVQSVLALLLWSKVYFPWGACSYLCSNCHLGVSSQAVLVVLASPNPVFLCTKEEIHFQLDLKHRRTWKFFPKPLIQPILPVS